MNKFDIAQRKIPRHVPLARLGCCCATVFTILLAVCRGPALAGLVTLAWDPNSETSLAGYKIYYGTTSRSYGVPIDVGNVTTYTISGLEDGKSFFFAATAYDTLGNESGYSNEVQKVVAPGLIEINLVGNAVSIADGDTTPSPEDHTDFGAATMNLDTVSRVFTIQNTGTETLILSGSPPVTIGGANAADFEVTSQPALSVPAGAYTTFTVRFDAAAVGARTATISIANNDPNESTYAFSIQGTGLAGVAGPEINIVGNLASIVDGDTSPSSADHTDFGGVDVANGSVIRTFTIQNKGTETLSLTGSPLIAIGGAQAADFTVVIEPAPSVAAGSSATFKVAFDPSAAGMRTATLTIASNDANESLYDFSIAGTGTTVTLSPEISLVGNSVSIADGDGTPSAADHTDFGSAKLLGGSVTRTFTIRNSGTGVLSLTGSPLIAIGGAQAGDFTVVSKPASSIAAGGSTAFQVTFSPTAAGVRDATLSIANNDANENPYNFSIRGTGASPSSAAPEIVLLGNAVEIVDGDTTPSAADFTDLGSAKIDGGSVTRTFTIRNTGTATLYLPGSPRVSVGGLHAADFVVVTQPSGSVAKGGSTSFQVRFKPGAVGSRGAAITIASDDANESPYNFAVRGTGTTPRINVRGNAASIAPGDLSPTAVDNTEFGSTNIAGGAVTHTFTIQNTGTAALSLPATPRIAVRGANAADFTVVAQPASSVATAGSTTFQVRFDPKAGGRREATLSIASDDASESPYDFAIQGTGLITPEIDLVGNGVAIADGDTTAAAADHTDFGGAKVDGATVTRTFTIRNTGSAPLSLAGSPPVAVTGPHAADFTVAVQPGTTVAVGGSMTFKVLFDPAAAGVRSATLSIVSDDLDEGAYSFAIQGLGTVPEIDVTGNGVTIVNGDTYTGLADFTDFGGVKLGCATVTRTFTIRNTGTAPLILTGKPRATVGGTHAMDFTVSLQPASPVAPGKSTKFQVRFRPTAVGARSARISIDNNDSNENPYNFTIKGTGTVPEINLLGNATRILDGDSTPTATDHTDFGKANIAGGTVTRTFTILNSGTAALTLSGSPRITGTHGSDFTIAATPPASVPAGGTATFQVRFDPKAAGLRMANISIASDDADENPYEFAVQGSGIVAPEIGLGGNGVAIAAGDATPATADQTDFGGARLEGGKVLHTFTIKNTGSARLFLTGTPVVAVSGADAADFAVAVMPALSVAAGGSTTFKILFDPTAAGMRTATIMITNDDADESSYAFAVSGEGVAPPAAPANVLLSAVVP